MSQINAYLTFSGNCREAMTFYKECIGGELTVQTIGESPLADKMPAKMKDCILHATLVKDAMKLYGSDMVPEGGLVKGNAVSLMLAFRSEDEIKISFEKLADGGEPTHPLENTFFGSILGGLTDKYGNHWLLNYYKK